MPVQISKPVLITSVRGLSVEFHFQVEFAQQTRLCRLIRVIASELRSSRRNLPAECDDDDPIMLLQPPDLCRQCRSPNENSEDSLDRFRCY